MKLTGDEAKALADEMRARSKVLEGIKDHEMARLIGHAIEETGIALRGVEDRIAEAGGLPPDIAVILLLYGAAGAVYDDMADGEDRRQMVEAGRAVGRLMAKKYGDKIEDELKTKAGRH